MYFITRPDWEIKNPAFSVFNNHKQPTYRWHIVEMRTSTYYYHVHVKPNSVNNSQLETNTFCGTIEHALNILCDYPRSTLSLLVPEWLNNGELGLYRVVAVYDSVNPQARTYVAECSDGKQHALHLDANSINIKLPELEKVKLWPHPHVD